MTTFVVSASCVGGVFDHGNAVFVGQGVERVEVECRTGVVHRDDGFGARRDRSLDSGHVGHQRVAVDVDEHWRGAQQGDHVGGGNPGLRRCNDFIAGTDTQCQQGDMHPAGGRGKCHGMSTTDVVGEVFFQCLVLRPGSDPSGTQYLLYGCDFFVADTGTGEREKRLAHGHLRGCKRK
ncbi:hypothetical protein D3C78_1111420 [compost metagenome]